MGAGAASALGQNVRGEQASAFGNTVYHRGKPLPLRSPEFVLDQAKNSHNNDPSTWRFDCINSKLSRPNLWKLYKGTQIIRDQPITVTDRIIRLRIVLHHHRLALARSHVWVTQFTPVECTGPHSHAHTHLVLLYNSLLSLKAKVQYLDLMMNNSLTLLALLGSLFFLLQLVLGGPLPSVKELAISSIAAAVDTRPTSIIARDGPTGTCVDVWEFGRMNRFTPGNSSRSMLNVCTPANTCIQPDAKNGWTHFRSLGFQGKGMGCLIFTQENCGEGQVLHPETDEMRVVDEWTLGVLQGDELPAKQGTSHWRSLKCWMVETAKRDAVASGTLDDVSSTAIDTASLTYPLENNKRPSLQFSDPSNINLQQRTILGTCVTVWEHGGKTGRVARNLCTGPDQCAFISRSWVGGEVGSLSFSGATQCFLFTREDCGFTESFPQVDKMLMVHANSAGVNTAVGADFAVAGPWRSLRCSRPW
ncbi:hypothetical protein FKW77_003133 [Venturia effusa]|uniref:Uncharacterized protein n=1 Tax=Venturia effusa TaxID=50376 RepID=A0A517LNL5_9PEZI|nr:hypothetical protein FKW77_003133 [Venturia effusa]